MKARILVVDDDTALAEMLTIVLRQEGFGSRMVARGDLGIEIDNVVDAPNTYAVFLRGPEHVRIEYVEHKPGFALT